MPKRALLLAIAIVVVVTAPLASARRLVSGNITAEATSAAGATVDYTVDPGTTCTPPPLSTFPIGTTQVDCTNDSDSSPAGFFNVTVQDTTPPSLTVPADITAEATSMSGASVSYPPASASDAVDPSPGVNCVPGSPVTVAINATTTVDCTATDSAGNPSSGSFQIHVVDNTDPTLTGGQTGDINDTTEVASGKTIHFEKPTASDLEGALAVTCNQEPDTNFSVGTTPVTCSATDGRGNVSSVSFNVNLTLVDTTDPVLSGTPANISQNTEVASGKVVTYTKPTANDNIDGPIPVSCAPDTGATFPVGLTTVTCSAMDAHGNSDSVTFTVNITLVDTTKPVLSVPGNISVTTELPSGKVVNYATPTANDNLDGPLPVTCSKASGTNFVLGATTVTCSATDAHGNVQQATFTVTVTLIDVTAPVFTGVSANRTVEANGPTGSIVNYTTPTATDALDGPIPGVSCTPVSGTMFPLGTTTVTCSATDAHSNTGTASFTVTVSDTTPPNLIVPVARSVYATTPTGIPDIVAVVVSFLNGASATDIVDAHPVVSENAPSFIPVGTHTVIFTAIDFSGNGVSREVTLIVLPQPPEGTPPLPIPPATQAPANIRNLTAVSLNGAIRLRWQTPAGVDHVVVTRFVAGSGQVVYSGSAATYLDRGLENGTEYRYVVASVDAAGNSSAGVAVVAVPRRNLLRSPKDGARLRKPPRLMWAANAEADYFNAQLLLNGRKILSVWPVKNSLLLKKSWKFQGRKYTLKPGLYQWYVWPGFGARSAVNYGELLGTRTFRIVR